MLQQNDKYLYAPYKEEKARISSKIWDLELIINIALSLNRIPVIKGSSDFLMSDKFARDLSIDWDKYIDLSKTKLLKVESGKITELSNTLRYVHERDFDFSSYSKKQIRHVDENQLYDEENERYSLICLRSIKNIKGQQKEMPRFYKNQGHASVASIARPSFLAIFSPSQEVNDLTDIVLNYFNTKRSDMELLFNILYPSFRNKHTNIYKCIPNLKYYGCMDVRYERSNNAISRLISKNITKIKIKKNIRKIRERTYLKNLPNLPFYLMSNIADVDYFDFSKSKYDIYRYTDFRELKEKLTAKESMDYNLLYMVEKNIMRYAPIKVLPSKMNSFAFEGRWTWYGDGFGWTLRQRIRSRGTRYF